MLNITLDNEGLLVLLEPKGALAAADFVAVAHAVDPWLATYGHLNGVVIHTRQFPGWESFAALISHLRFVKDHHQKIRRVAIATDSSLGGFAQTVASHFVAAEIRAFAYGDLDRATAWARGHAA